MLNNHLRDYQTDENNNPKSKECLLVKPSRELTFVHLKSKYVADINLLNRKDESVLYKVRTTAAKSYVVLPTIGIIPPNRSVAIKIYMPKTEEVQDRISDKFLIQAFIYKGDDLKDDVVVLNQAFDHLYKSIPSKEVQNTKLRVYFESHTVIEEEISEDGTPARNYSPFKITPKPEDNLDLSMKYKKESNFTSSINTQQPSQVLTAMSPEPDSSTFKSAKQDYDSLSRVLPEDSFRASVNKSDAGSYRNITSEPRSYYTPIDKSKTFEQDIFPPSYRDMDNVGVARSLREELEKETKKASLNNITNSYRKEQNGYSNSNEVSMYTEFSDVRSDMSVNEQLSKYKHRLQILENKFNEQQALINKLTQEKDKYQKQAQDVRRGSASLSTTADETKLDNNRHRLDVWHIVILCIVSMILGSIFR